MVAEHVLAIDLANVYADPDARSADNVITTLAWGNFVDVDEGGSTDDLLKIRVTQFDKALDGSITSKRVANYINSSR